MTVTLHTRDVWSRLTALARQQQGVCAVPYFGAGASKLLPLMAGSVLIVKFDKESIQASQVNPEEVIRLIKRGVEVHACANLHAKVFVFGNTAIVGSANVSQSSANHLLEACVETRSPSFAEECRKFVRSLSGDVVGLEFAKEMTRFYRPPSTKTNELRTGKRQVPRHSDLWLVSLTSGGWDDVDYEHEESGRSRAEQALKSPKTSDIETFVWCGSRLGELRRGERIIMNTKVDNRKSLVSPPGRVLDIKKYLVNNRRRAIVYLEIPKGRRRRNETSLIKSLGPLAKALGHPRRTKRIRNAELVYRLDKVFQ